MKKVIHLFNLTLAVFGTSILITEKTYMLSLVLWLAYASYCLGVFELKEVYNLKINKK